MQGSRPLYVTYNALLSLSQPYTTEPIVSKCLLPSKSSSIVKFSGEKG